MSERIPDALPPIAPPAGPERKPVDVRAVMDAVERDYKVLLPEQVAQIREMKEAVLRVFKAANNMMTQDAVQRATELTNPFMAGAADDLSSALRKAGAR